MVLLKSADVLSNGTEMVLDYTDVGDALFDRFSASKHEKIDAQIKLIDALLTQYPQSPLADDLFALKDATRAMQ